MIEDVRYCAELALYATAIALGAGMLGGIILHIVDIFKNRGNK